ncbi:Epithelial splicing regulatory protein 2 [Liparis tanakae]|uniref:Epithelial splicing regulatory protein 2 n=1 Tax=Liparis tanakae TaxID=230148 RepID=A0A4Z2HP53_9TELE|nr:Epithelial splicing regulatory protein 2 [Liparis tanakae]
MASHSDTLVVFFGATAGANGGKLGSDEREIILLVWQIVDLHEKKVGKLHRCLVKPETLELTDECKEDTGLTAEDLAEAEPLDKVLQQVSLPGATIGAILHRGYLKEEVYSIITSSIYCHT